MLQEESLGCKRPFVGKPFVASVWSFRRSPGIDGDAVDAWRILQIIKNMRYILPVLEIGRIDIYAVYLIINGECFGYGHLCNFRGRLGFLSGSINI